METETLSHLIEPMSPTLYSTTERTKVYNALTTVVTIVDLSQLWIRSLVQCHHHTSHVILMVNLPRGTSDFSERVTVFDNGVAFVKKFR